MEKGSVIMNDKITLTANDILEKEFKIDARGYRLQEVDKFLDVIIRDYEEMSSVIKELETEKKSLIEDNIRLKQEIRNMSTKLDVLKDSDLNESSNTNNADVLRRLSNLEKIIYGRE